MPTLKQNFPASAIFSYVRGHQDNRKGIFEELSKSNDYTYDEYLERWNSRYRESQSAEVNYSSHGVILPMTINRLSPEIFGYTKTKLRKLQEEFDFSSEMNYEEGMEKTLLEMIPYELVLLIT